MQRLTSPEQVQAAMQLAPQTTRASLRGQVIKAAQEKGRILGVDWVNLRLDGTGTQVALQDPFATQDPRITALVDLINSGER